MADLEIDKDERALRSNLIGPVLCCKHFVRHRKQNGGGGKIINVTSIHEDIPNPGGVDYDTSKSALFLRLGRLRLRDRSTYVMDGGLMRNVGQGA